MLSGAGGPIIPAATAPALAVSPAMRAQRLLAEL